MLFEGSRGRLNMAMIVPLNDVSPTCLFHPNRLFILLFGIYSVTHLTKGNPDSLIVTIDSGKVRGVTLTAATNRELDAWLGIPYATPPLGDLRFRHPQPVDPWTGIYNATELPNSCWQIVDDFFEDFEGANMWNPNTEVSEDCLYLSVYVPKPRPENAAVLLWIYGGGFYSGTSTLEVYDPRILVSQENIIVVSIQYRVASLGFLYFGTDDVPGNSGLYDQLMAITWTRSNIQHFGGNPMNITLFGESAGAVSVSFHLLSPLSRGLFSQGILQSTSALAPWAVMSKNESFIRGLRLAKAVGCPHSRENLSAVINCLKDTDPKVLVYDEWFVFGICEFPFVPVIDGVFLFETPQQALTGGNFKKTNIIAGINTDEGYYFIMYFLSQLFRKEENVFVNREEYEQSVKDLNRYLPPPALEAIIHEYTDWNNPEDPILNRDALDKMVGDYQFACSVIEWALRYAESGCKVYLYYFTHRSSIHPWPNWTGVMHGDEINFVFGEPLNESKGYQPKEVQFGKKVMKYWANFAKTGDPSSSADGTWTEQYWPVHTPYKRDYFVLNPDVMDKDYGLRTKQCALWNKLIPKILFRYSKMQAAIKAADECRASGGHQILGTLITVTTLLALPTAFYHL